MMRRRPSSPLLPSTTLFRSRYSGIEQVLVDGMEGNDTFFEFSTPEGVDLQLIGGLGSDTFNVAGGTDGKAIDVVADDLRGHSGLIEHRDANSDVINTLDINVMDNDEAGVRIMPLQDSYKVIEGVQSVAYAGVRTRPPKKFVSFEAKASPSGERSIPGSEGVMLNGRNGAEGITLLFDKSNWFIPQEIEVTGIDASLTEGNIAYSVKHKVTDGFGLDGDSYRSDAHKSEIQSLRQIVCHLLLEKNKQQ